MVPPLCYKHNDIHSELINALVLPSFEEPLPSPPTAAPGGTRGQGRGQWHRDVPPPHSLHLISWETKQG